MGMRVALITGGSSGIGRGIAEKFLENNYFVHIIGKSSENLEICRSEIKSDRVCFYKGDIVSADFVTGVINEVSSHSKHLDILVNAAGIYLGSGGVEEPLERWEKILQVNLFAQFLVVQKSVPVLKLGNKPGIINISSVCSLYPYSSCTSTSYSVSKAGLDMLTKRLAQELASDGIRVNSINPGVVTSNIWKRSGATLEQHLAWKKNIRQERHPLGRTGEPADIANLALFLASEESEWMTGSIIPLDGGYSIS